RECLQVQATFLAVFVLVNCTRTKYSLFHHLFSLNRAVLAVEQQIQQIRTALGRIRTIKKSLTEVGKGVTVIKAEADALSTDIQSALKSIEQTLSFVGSKSID
ncbi:MAG: hypothetical protein ACYT04_47370, partial [Nostoc sp.]